MHKMTTTKRGQTKISTRKEKEGKRNKEKATRSNKNTKGAPGSKEERKTE